MTTSTTTTWLPAKSWQHFLAGGYAHTHNSLNIPLLIKSAIFFSPYSLGGMCGAIVTSPFDVVKTRLQSDLFRQKHAGVGAVVGDSVVLVRRPGGILWNFVETAHIIRCVTIYFPFSFHFAHMPTGILRETSLPARYLRVSCPRWWGSSPRVR